MWAAQLRDASVPLILLKLQLSPVRVEKQMRLRSHPAGGLGLAEREHSPESHARADREAR